MSAPLGVLFAPAVGVADTGFESSRVMQTKPHGDGLIMAGPSNISVSGPNPLVLTRSAAGLWQLTRTAGGAETYFMRTTLGEILRTGEHFQFGGFGSDKQATDTPPKGVGIIDAFAVYQVGVVALTSATLRIGRTVYAASPTAPVQTDLVAATATGLTATGASPFYVDLPVPPGSQVYETADLSLVEVELSVVMANTGTFGLAALGFHVAFNGN